MAERKETTEEKEHRAAARAAGQQLGPRKMGGTILEADGRVTYTQGRGRQRPPRGAARPHHPAGPVRGGRERGGLRVLDRGDAAPLTGDASPSSREEKK